MYRHNESLFCKYDLRTVIDNQTRAMVAAIDEIEGKQLPTRLVDAWAKEFAARYSITPITLDESGIRVDQEEVEVDASCDFGRAIFDRGRPFNVKGVSVSFFIPFAGEEDLLRCRPSTFTMNPPHGDVDGRTLIVTFTRTDHDSVAVKAEFERQLGSIKGYLETIAHDVGSFNAGLRDIAKQHVERRMEKVRKDQAMIAGLGFPRRNG